MSDEGAPGSARTEQPPTRRSRRGRADLRTPPRSPNPVVVRPSRPQVLLVGAIAAGIPAVSRGSAQSLQDLALVAGPGGRHWLALVGYEALVVTWTALVLLRSMTVLSGAPGVPPVLEVRGALRRRTTPLGDVRRVVLVTVAARGGSTTQRALLLDGTGRVVTAPTHSRAFWLREDTRAVLRAAGITVEWDHRRSAPADLEVAYPGSSVWTDRHPVLLAALVAVGLIACLMAVGWLLES